MAVGENPVFTEIHKSDHIAALVEIAGLVSHPDLDAGDSDSRPYERQFRGPAVVIVTEEMAHEKMSVAVILVSVYFESGGLHPSFRRD